MIIIPLRIYDVVFMISNINCLFWTLHACMLNLNFKFITQLLLTLQMTDCQTSNPMNQYSSKFSKISNWDNQPLVLSARPKIEQLPFLNNLKRVRQLLMALKNQKLRKSLYIVTQNNSIPQKQVSDVYRHQKAKLSVMDLISQQGKLQELSNTIQSNLDRKTNPSAQLKRNQENQVQKVKMEMFKVQFQPPCNFQNKKQKAKDKPSILTKKNYLAQQLNKLGHQLQQTYFQVEQLQKIFQTLCQFYSSNRKTVQNNLKMKYRKESVKEQIRQFKEKIKNNQKDQIRLTVQTHQFISWYKESLKQYLKQVITFNKHNDQTIDQLVYQHKIQKNQIKKQQAIHKSEKKNDTFSNINQQLEDKTFQIDLKFRQLRSQFQRVKNQKKNAGQNKNKQKKPKNDNNQSSSFSKLYVSQIYSL